MSDFPAFEELLSSALARRLEISHRDFASETMRVFDLGCFPWHGYLELSFLTANEPQLRCDRRPEELIAEWRLYNFAATGRETTALSASMQRHWVASADKTAVSALYFEACARAVISKEVTTALSAYQCSADFYVRVVNPDDLHSKNYCRNIAP